MDYSILFDKDTTKKRKWVQNGEIMLSVSDLTVFAKMLQCHQMPMKSQEMTKSRYHTVTLILDFNSFFSIALTD